MHRIGTEIGRADGATARTAAGATAGTWLPPRARSLAAAAVGALLDEAELTPKPALVDRRGSGAHHDLSLGLLRRSARSLEPWFAQMAQAAEREAAGVRLRERLGALGRRAEAAMLEATGGANAHRGAIWALGLLVAAAASFPASADALCAQAARLAAIPDRFAGASGTHGGAVLLKFGAAGARAEALAGFPHVREAGLPALRGARRRGIAEPHARLDSLLSIMRGLEDTCLLYRGGREALQLAQQGAAQVLAAGGSSTAEGARALGDLHLGLLRAWASPGGSADLLAATLFVDRLFPEAEHA